WALGAVAVLLIGLLAVGAACWRGGTPSENGDEQKPGPLPLNGKMTAKVWSAKANGEELGVNPDAVPVLEGDKVRVDATFNQPAHVYIVWVDSTGGLIPLYPWNKGDDVNTRALGEVESEAVEAAGTPGTITRGWPCDDNAGLETIL